MTINILLVGASGWLGAKVAGELVAMGNKPRMLLRGGPSHPKAGQLKSLVAAGAQIIDGDLSDTSSLRAATDQIDVVISTVQGGPEVVVDGQVNLAKVALANGVKRIFPSDFAVRFRGVTPERHLFLGWRAQADAAIAEIGLPQVNTFNGAFMEMLSQDFFGLIDWQAGQVRFWGDLDQAYDFTHTDDVARFVAAAAVNENHVAGDFEIIGQSASPTELAAMASKVTGRTFGLASHGSLDDLDQAIAKHQAASPENPMPWAGLQYHRLMADGSGKLHAPSNDQYRDVSPMGIENFIAQANLGKGTP